LRWRTFLSQAVNSAITIRDDTGPVLLQDTITQDAVGWTISVLGIPFNGTGAFSTIPALGEVGEAQESLPDKSRLCYSSR
jgi:hypothetical protein